MLRTSQLLAPIKVVEAAGKHDTAQRLQQRITAIMRYGFQIDIVNFNPANEMAGALATYNTPHYLTLTPVSVPQFLHRLSAYDGRIMTPFAVELPLLT